MDSPSSTMVLGAQKLARPRSGQDWDAKKGTLQRLYLKENKPLKRMYKRQFMKWKWRKYNSEGLRQSQLSGDRVEMVEGEMTCQRPRRRRLGPPLGRKYAGRQENGPLPILSTCIIHGSENDRLSYGLLLNLHDLIQGASHRDPEWHRRAKFNYLPIPGRHFKALARLGAYFFDIKEFKRGGTIFQEAFRGIEGILDQEPIAIFRMLLLEIPHLLTDHGILQSYLKLVSDMLSIKQRGRSIHQIAQYMSSIAASCRDNLLEQMKRLRILIMDEYVGLRGRIDLHSIEATVEAMNWYDNERRARSRSDLLGSYEALLDEAKSTFGNNSFEDTRVEHSRVVATSLLMNHESPDFLALCHRHLSRLAAANNNGPLQN
ncbi:N1-acetylpolyamine oxidase [Colletotrichum asianum]